MVLDQVAAEVGAMEAGVVLTVALVMALVTDLATARVPVQELVEDMARVVVAAGVVGKAVVLVPGLVMGLGPDQDMVVV